MPLAYQRLVPLSSGRDVGTDEAGRVPWSASAFCLARLIRRLRAHRQHGAGTARRRATKLTRGAQHGYPYRPGAATPTVRFRLEGGVHVGRPPAGSRTLGRRPSRPFAFLGAVEAADLGVEVELLDDVAGVGVEGRDRGAQVAGDLAG